MRASRKSIHLACKVRYNTREKIEKSRFRVIVDPKAENSHETWNFQLFIPRYANNHYMLSAFQTLKHVK